MSTEKKREEKKHSNANESYQIGNKNNNRVTKDRQPDERRLQQSP